MGVWPILTNVMVNTFSTDLIVSIDVHVTIISLQQGQLKRLSKNKISSLFSSLFQAGVQILLVGLAHAVNSMFPPDVGV